MKRAPLPFTRAAYRAAYIEELTAAIAAGAAYSGSPHTVPHRVGRMLEDVSRFYLATNASGKRAAKRFGISTDKAFRAAWGAATPEDVSPCPAVEDAASCRCGVLPTPAPAPEPEDAAPYPMSADARCTHNECGDLPGWKCSKVNP